MRPRTLSRRRKLLFSVVVCFVFFGILECVLWLSGFEAATRVETMAFTFPMDDYNRGSSEPFLERDPDLFWKPRPGIMGHNSQGCSGPEFSLSAREGVFRIVCLGDSCTHFGPDSYPAMLQSLLQKEAPGKFEVINAGVIGYTSFQGLALLKRRVISWSPDLVTVYFGWNDHWLARDFADTDQSNRVPSLLRLRNALDHSRTIQLAQLAYSQFTSPSRPGMRVAIDDYRSNLREMFQACEAMWADMWLITAPHALDISIPPYLMTSGEVDDPSLLVSLHRRYNSAVRQVAAEQQITLIDLEDEIDTMDKAQLFLDDRIHLSDLGKSYTAQRLLTELHLAGLLEHHVK